MALIEHRGFEIYVGASRWEVYDEEGNVLADGRGGEAEARLWIDAVLERLVIAVEVATRTH